MKRFVFQSNNGVERTVEASTEQDARVLAMKAIWGGTIFTINGFSEPYKGEGLYKMREMEIENQTQQA